MDRGPLRLFSSLAWNGPDDAIRRGSSWIDLAERPFELQAEAVYDLMEAALQDAGGLSSVLRQHMYQRDKRRFPILESVRQKRELDGAAPSSGLGLASLRNEWVTYELDAIALNAAGRDRLGSRRLLETPGVGEAAALYSQAVAAGPYIFTAGMLGLTADRSWAVTSFDEIASEGRWLQRGRSHPDHRMGPVVAQTWTLYERFDAFLRAHDLHVGQVVNVTIFIHDDGDFADALRVHSRWFGVEGPAVQVIPVDEVGHKGTVIEIEITATRGEVRRTRGTNAEGEPPAVVEAGDLVFASDHLPITGEGRVLSMGELDAFARRERGLPEVLGTLPRENHLVAAQTWAALRNLSESLERSDVDAACLGQITVRLAGNPPTSSDWLDRMVRLVLGDVDRAFVRLDVPSIPHSPYALAAIAGVGGVDGVEKSAP